jgi:hypothetical protein
MTEQLLIEKTNRSFKVKLSQDSISYGRYNGDSPYQAANKALSEIIRNKNKNNEDINGKITFWLIESTKGSAKRIHQYEGERIKLAEPVKYNVGDNVIVKEYKNNLKKIKKAVQLDIKNTKKKTEIKKVTKKTTKLAKATKKTTKKLSEAKAKKTTKSNKTTKTSTATKKKTVVKESE